MPTITGTNGNDTLTGAAGADMFLFEYGTGDSINPGQLDIVTNYEVGVDQLRIGYLGANAQIVHAVWLSMREAGGSTFLTYAGGVVEIVGVTGRSLGAWEADLSYPVIYSNFVDPTVGGPESSILVGTYSVDAFTGGASADVIIPGAGNAADQVDGGGGFDFVSYGDSTIGGGQFYLYPGGVGYDLFGAVSFYSSIEGVIGTAFGDFMRGRQDFSGDALVGGDGQDILQEASNLTGGGGRDVFVITNLPGTITVWDFQVGLDVFAGDVFVSATTDGTQTFLSAAGGQNFIIKGIADSDLSHWNSAIADSLTMFGGSASLSGGDDVYFGTPDDNAISGLGGRDVINASDGNDTLDGGAGDDFLDGGLGNDVYVLDSAGDVVSEGSAGGTDEIRTGLNAYNLNSAANVEKLTFTGTGDFAGTGSAAANAITGGSGNDTLDGGAGADTLIGGAGDDLYIIDSASDVVLEDANAGTDSIQTALNSFSLASRANVENLLFAGAGDFAGTGNSLANAITGGAGVDTLNGGAGIDTLTGGAGDDRYNLYGGADVVVEQSGGGTDKIYTDLTALDLNNYDNVENLEFETNSAVHGIGNALSNQILGGGGADLLEGGDGDDTLNGGVGIDTLVGGAGDDTYVLSTSASDQVIEDVNSGIDTIQTHLGVFSLVGFANVENLFVNPNSYGASVTGNALNNHFTIFPFYYETNDTIDGGLGADTMEGAGGNDIYVVDDVNDVIVEFTGNDTIWTTLNNLALAAYSGIENLSYVGAGSFSGAGNSYANALSSSAGNDSLEGGDGADTLNGGGGADTLIGGGGNDVYVVDDLGDVVVEDATADIDTVQSLTNAFSLAAIDNVENLTFTGAGAFSGAGNTLANIITGGSGADTLDGGAGADTLIGGTGNDTYVVDALDTVTEGAGAGTDTLQTALNTFSINAIANVENLTFIGAGDFSGAGNAAANILTGGAGNDTLNGGAGNDTLIGGAGDDIYVVDSASDVVTEAASAGIDTIQTALTTFSMAAIGNVENLTYTGSAVSTMTGNALANFITGGSNNDFLYGGDGDDTFDGGAGNDSLIGGLGDDTFIVVTGDLINEQAGGGTDTIRTTSNSYSLSPTTYVENLTYTGTGGFAGTGNSAGNVITGGAGNDTLDGGSGADTLIGGAGNDTYIIDNVGDVVTEDADAGSDTIRTAFLTYSLAGIANVENLTYAGPGTGPTGFTGTGNELANVITGGNNTNTLNGGDGNDTLIGGTAADTLIGAAGNDSMAGGAGDDIYVVEDAGDVVSEGSNAGSDTIETTLNSYSMGLILNVERLTFTGSGNFSGVGNSLANTITGDAGADTLNGGTGSDTLIGGAGDDVYVVDAAADVVTENAASGSDTIQTNLATYSLAALTNIENLTYTGTLLFAGTGNALANILTGGSLNDTLDGGAGADTLIGGLGNDVYRLDNAGDQVSEAASAGTDTIETTFNSFDLSSVANIENLTFTGAGNFTGYGNESANVITGGAGADTLDGGAGADTLAGGLGNDIFIIDNANVRIMEGFNAGTDTVRTTSNSLSLASFANVETLTFTGTGNFSGIGNSLSNTLKGGDGDDTLDGGAGIDTLIGGAGNDVYFIGNEGNFPPNEVDTIVELAGGGVDTVFVRVPDYTLAPNVENAVTLYPGSVRITGNALNNHITGGSTGGNYLDGGAGADTLIGGTAGDTYIVDDISDVVVETSGVDADTIRTSLNSYSLMPTANVELLIFTGSGNFNGVGNAAANRIHGGGGADTLDGGAGADTLYGGEGSDTYYIDDAGDFADESGSTGIDTIVTSLANFWITSVSIYYTIENLTYTGSDSSLVLANSRNNVLTGGSGADTFFGYEGSDTLLGGAGNDQLDGGAGADSMVGGVGDDIYVVSGAGDVVTELASEGDDTVWLDLDVSNYQPVNIYQLSDHTENLIAQYHLDYQLIGNALDNRITASSGNDTLDGAAGADTLTGSTGNDIYIVDSVGDQVVESANQGTDTVRTSLSTYSLASLGNVENLTFTGSGAFVGEGNASANVLVGGAGADSISGGDGADTLTGGAGNDRLIGGLGEDTAVFSGVRANYSIVRTPAGTYTITDLRTGVTDGVDTLNGIERVVFSDQAITLSAASRILTAAFTVNPGEAFSDAPAFELQGTIAYTFRNDGDITSVGSTNAGATLTSIVSQNANVIVENNGLIDLTVTGGGARAVSGPVGQVVNTGTIAAEGADYAAAIYSSNSVTLTNADGGTLRATTSNGAAVGVEFLNAAYVQNDGSIEATTTVGYAWGIRFGGFDNGYLNNTGTISAVAGSGYSSIGLDVNSLSTQTANAPNVVNSGTIRGDMAVYGGDGVEYVLNNGTLGGDVDLVGGADRLINNGLIDGRVYMGGDNDYVDTRLGTISGVTYLGGGADQFLGSGNAEGVDGGDGNDTLSGGGGADTLIGGAGSDTYVIDVADVTVTEYSGQGTDTVRTTLATYTLDTTIENLVLIGAALNGFGNAANNSITGNSNANVLRGFGGDDTLDGGAGSDWVSYSDAGSGVIVNLATGVATGEGGDRLISIENLIGSDFSDSLTGSGFANILNGRGGADTLNGGGGADTLIGGDGNDTYVVDASGATITEATGEGTDVVRSSLASYMLASEVENLVLTGAAAANGFGNAGNNHITGNANNNTLKGFGGDDTLDGGSGTDTVSYSDASGGVMANIFSGAATGDGTDTLISIENLIGSMFNDSLTGGADANSISGGAGADTLDGSAGADTMVGGGGDDVFIVDNAGDVTTEQFSVHGYDQVQSSVSWTLGGFVERLTLTGTADLNGTGNELANLLEGNSGRNTLTGGVGADTMIGGAGGDTYYVDNTGDLTTEMADEGSDRVFSSVNRTLAANIENLTLTGNANIAGGGNALANVINGNSGANTLNGNLGADTLTGGLGADTFLFNTAIGGGNIDRITDYNVVDDTIVLENAVFTALSTNGALSSGNFRKGAVAADSNDFIIYQVSTGALFYDADGNGAGMQIQIATLNPNLPLTANDFLLI